MSGGSEFQSLMVLGTKEYIKHFVLVDEWMNDFPELERLVHYGLLGAGSQTLATPGAPLRLCALC